MSRESDRVNKHEEWNSDSGRVSDHLGIFISSGEIDPPSIPDEYLLRKVNLEDDEDSPYYRCTLETMQWDTDVQRRLSDRVR